jgi:hypothetical protein
MAVAIQSSAQSFAYANIALSLFAFVSNNHVILYQLLDSFQLISFLSYVNVNTPSNLQSILSIYYQTNFASLFPSPFSSFSDASGQ